MHPERWLKQYESLGETLSWKMLRYKEIYRYITRAGNLSVRLYPTHRASRFASTIWIRECTLLFCKVPEHRQPIKSSCHNLFFISQHSMCGNVLHRLGCNTFFSDKPNAPVILRCGRRRIFCKNDDPYERCHSERLCLEESPAKTSGMRSLTPPVAGSR